ncbi:hypothetical protein, partial [Paenibacillus terreus]
QTPNTKHQTPNTKHQTPNTKHQTPNTIPCRHLSHSGYWTLSGANPLFPGRLEKSVCFDSASTPAVDPRFAQLHQGLFTDFMLRKLSLLDLKIAGD